MHRTSPANPLFLRDEALDQQLELHLLGASGLAQSLAAVLHGHQIDDLDYLLLLLLVRHQGLHVGVLSKIVGRPKQIVSRRLQQLEARGLVLRQPDPRDGRRRQLVMSDDGRRVVDDATDAARRFMRRAFARSGSQAVDGFAQVNADMIAPSIAGQLGLIEPGERR